MRIGRLPKNEPDKGLVWEITDVVDADPLCHDYEYLNLTITVERHEKNPATFQYNFRWRRSGLRHLSAVGSRCYSAMIAVRTFHVAYPLQSQSLVATHRKQPLQ